MLTSRICTQEQFATPWFRSWSFMMADPPRLHRKQWEYCYIAEALRERGMLQPGKRGLGFAVGQEPLPSLFAGLGCAIVATDLHADRAEAAEWARSDQHANQLNVLNLRGLCDADEFDRLVSFRPVDMSDIPSDLVDFDFIWSACALEHLGTLDDGANFIHRAMECLRPGGVAVHTTEFNVSSNSDTYSSGAISIYRRQDIESIARTLVAEGCEIEVNFDPGSRPADSYISRPPYKDLPHLKLKLGDYVSSSIGLIITKNQIPLAKGVAHSTTPPPLDDGEKERRVVKDLFQGILKREPDVESENAFSTALRDGMPVENLVTTLIDSDEFSVRRPFSRLMSALNADITIDLQGCEPHFGPLRLRGAAADEVFGAIAQGHGLWQTPVTSVLNHVLRPGDTFVDAGANVGYFTVLAGSRVSQSGRVLAFEPSSAARHYCEENVRLNGLTNVVVYPYALWNRRQQMRLARPEGSPSYGHLRKDRESEFETHDSETVECVSIDELMRTGELELTECHLVKMDIEGAEPLALEGMAQMLEVMRPGLLLELNTHTLGFFDLTAATLLEIVADLGYDVTVLVANEEEREAFKTFPSVSPWPDLEMRAVFDTSRFLESVAALDRSEALAHPLDLLALPRGVHASRV